ncbi:MAG: hypothetical protein JXK16_03505 [Thiotrichales bacterium]|nr:hypothetical protein [Thiotrichales bacterium]
MKPQPGLLKTTKAKVIEMALNEAIRLDEMQGRAFEPLEDSVINVTLTDIQIAFDFAFTAYGVSVSSEPAPSVDSVIETTFIDFLALPKQAGLPNAKLSGNEIKAEQFIHALATLEIDWEEHLSHYTGDLIAFKIGHGVRSILQAKQSAKQQAGDTLKEYLQFELQAVPTPSQVAYFNSQVTQTAEAVDSLAERIEALIQTTTQSNKSNKSNTTD